MQYANNREEKCKQKRWKWHADKDYRDAINEKRRRRYAEMRASKQDEQQAGNGGQRAKMLHAMEGGGGVSDESLHGDEDILKGVKHATCQAAGHGDSLPF